MLRVVGMWSWERDCFESHCSSEREIWGTRRHGEMKQVAVAQSSCGKEEQMYPNPSLSWGNKTLRTLGLNTPLEKLGPSSHNFHKANPIGSIDSQVFKLNPTQSNVSRESLKEMLREVIDKVWWRFLTELIFRLVWWRADPDSCEVGQLMIKCLFCVWTSSPWMDRVSQWAQVPEWAGPAGRTCPGHAHIASLIDWKIRGYFLVPMVWIFDAPPRDLSMMERSCNGKTGKSTSYVLFYCSRINTGTHQTADGYLPSLIWVQKYLFHGPALKTLTFLSLDNTFSAKISKALPRSWNQILILHWPCKVS